MFELDYLTQRLTFTRSDLASTGAHRRLRPDLRGRRRSRSTVETARAAAGPARRLRPARSRPAAGPYVDGEDGAWAVRIADRAARGRLVACAPSSLVDEAVSRVTIVRRPSAATSLLGGSISLPPNACRTSRRDRSRRGRASRARPARSPWSGAGKMGLPLAAQFASHGWQVIAVDVNPAVVDAINAGRSHVDEEPGLADARARASTPRAACGRPCDGGCRGARGGRRRPDRPGHARRRAAARTTATWTPAVAAIAPGRPRGLDRHLRDDAADRRHARPLRAARSSGRPAWSPSATCSSRSRPSACSRGAVLANLATYPKLVGGVGAASTDRARGVLRDRSWTPRSSRCRRPRRPSSASSPTRRIATSTSPWPTSSPRQPTRIGIDVQEVIAAANSQPYSHIHQPGHRRRRPLHPGLPALAARRRARSSARGGGARGQRRPGRSGHPTLAARCWAALDGVAGARARADLSRRRQGARLLAGRCR